MRAFQSRLKIEGLEGAEMDTAELRKGLKEGGIERAVQRSGQGNVGMNRSETAH
jgi:hypothetical protein